MAAKKTADTPLRVPTKKEKGQVGMDEVVVLVVDISGLVFAIDDITAEQVEDFLVAATSNGIREQAKIMASLAVSCPEEWGAPNEAETYSKLKFRVFREAREFFITGLNDLGKN